MMPEFLQFFCRTFGWNSCAAMSTFEALALFGVLVFCVMLVFVFFVGLLAAIAAAGRENP